jgi:aspartyl-tRNA(Asn)/glutamyl-tRNA(Gln) amidotransferase subunit C
MSLTFEQVQHIANLARIELSQEELGSYRTQLSAILDYFQRLQEVDTENVPPAVSGFELPGGLRDDRPLSGIGVEEALQNAADRQDRQFKVPPVFE